MDIEMKDEIGLTLERLAAAAALLEQTADRLVQHAEAKIDRIVATVEARHEVGLEERLVEAHLKIAELQAREAVASPLATRKTLPLAMSSLLAKQGVTVDSLEAGALDAALVSLSVEQRIAVKSQLIRAGLLG